MDIRENEGQYPQDFFYRIMAAVSLLIFFIVIVIFIMTISGAFNTEEPDNSNRVVIGEGYEDAVTNEDMIDVDASPEETAAVETTAAETLAPTVTIAPELVAEFDPGTVDQTHAFASDLASLYPNTVLGVTDDAGAEYLSRIIFLGDSTTYGLKRYGMLTGGKNTTQVWTPESGTLTLWNAGIATIVYPDTGEQITIADAVSRHQPDILVVTLGVNGVATMKEDYFKSEYKKMIENIQTHAPNTKIICQSIFPVAASYANLDQINNQKITAANGWIVEVADECGVKYLDTYSALVGSDGNLPEDYQNGDGMHLNEVGFKIELDYIRTHAID